MSAFRPLFSFLGHHRHFLRFLSSFRHPFYLPSDFRHLFIFPSDFRAVVAAPGVLLSGRLQLHIHGVPQRNLQDLRGRAHVFSGAFVRLHFRPLGVFFPLNRWDCVGKREARLRLFRDSVPLLLFFRVFFGVFFWARPRRRFPRLLGRESARGLELLHAPPELAEDEFCVLLLLLLNGLGELLNLLL